MRDIFVSYTSSDRECAHWIAAELRAQGKHAVIHVYDAGHAFFNETKDAYRPEAAKLAWERTLAFFSRALR